MSPVFAGSHSDVQVARFRAASLLFLFAIACALTARAQVIGDIYASDASIRGSVLLASSGAQVMSGSTVGAGTSAAVLRLARGGEVRICPKTSITVNASQNGHDLMLGLSTGSLEVHYTLDASADSIVTPDFRLLLAGPGTFQFAVATDSQGNTSLRSLAGNAASVIVSELMGDGSYQVRPGDEIVFHQGKVANPDHLVPPDCGCPEPKNLLANAAPPTPPPAPAVKAAATPSDVHVQVDAPFVYHAEEAGSTPVYGIARLTLTKVPHLDLNVMPPPPQPVPATVATAAAPSHPAERKKGFFRRMKAFFASVFR